MADVIRLIYVEHGKTYHGKINKTNFLDQMKHIVDWFPNCNDNAVTLCGLLPDIDCIIINQDIIDTQDVPFILYTTIGDSTEKYLKFRRSYSIIWNFFLHHCKEAKENNI